MKKIFLFLALLSLGVSKAQVVGGYLPLNSTKSATMGGLRVNGNETVTGTFSVGSTATVGTLYSAGTIRSASGTSSLTGLNNNGNLITSTFESTSTGYMDSKLRVGSVVAPSATLDVSGTLGVSSTFSLGSANLTGGNTGTVAVLSDVPFALNCIMPSSNLVDATTYSIGNVPFAGGGFQTGKVYIPYNCTLVGWTANYFVNGTLASNETGTLAININGTPTNLNTSITQSAIVNTYSASGLSTNVTAGNYVEALIYTPTWATNPTSMGIGITFWFVRRS